MQVFHELFERNLLMNIRLDRALSGLPQEIVETVASVDARSYHDRVHKEPYEVFDLRQAPVGHRYSNGNIRLAAVLMEQRLESREESHEYGRALDSTKPPGRAFNLRGNVELYGRAI